MGYMKIKQGTETFDMFQEYWKLIQTLWKVENTDKYWNQVREECNLFVRKYNKSKFAMDLAVALQMELERMGMDGQ